MYQILSQSVKFCRLYITKHFVVFFSVHSVVMLASQVSQLCCCCFQQFCIMLLGVKIILPFICFPCIVTSHETRCFPAMSHSSDLQPYVQTSMTVLPTSTLLCIFKFTIKARARSAASIRLLTPSRAAEWSQTSHNLLFDVSVKPTLTSQRFRHYRHSIAMHSSIVTVFSLHAQLGKTINCLLQHVTITDEQSAIYNVSVLFRSISLICSSWAGLLTVQDLFYQQTAKTEKHLHGINVTDIQMYKNECIKTHAHLCCDSTCISTNRILYLFWGGTFHSGKCLQTFNAVEEQRTIRLLYISIVYALCVLYVDNIIYRMNPVALRPLTASSNNGILSQKSSSNNSITQFFRVFITVDVFSSVNFEKYRRRLNNVRHIICRHICQRICISFAYGWLQAIVLLCVNAP